MKATLTTATYYLLIRLSGSFTLSTAPRSLRVPVISGTAAFLLNRPTRRTSSCSSGYYFATTSRMNVPQSRSSPRLKAAKKSSAEATAATATPVVQTPVKQTPRPSKRRRVVTPQTSPAAAKEEPASSTAASSSPESASSSSQFLTSQRPGRIPDSEFEDLNVSPEELRPSTTLTTGQCFHWKAISSTHTAETAAQTSAWGNHNETEWIGCLRVSASASSSSQSQSVVVVIRETPTTTLYRVLHAPAELNVVAFLRDYFQLDEPLAPLYRRCAATCVKITRI